MDVTTLPVVRDEDVWLDRTENALLQLDEVMFPEEPHLLFAEADIDYHVTYQNEQQAYLFNSADYLREFKATLVRHSVPPERAFTEVLRSAAILSAYAVRLRAWDLRTVPLRTLSTIVADDRIPFLWRRMISSNGKIRAYDAACRGDLKKTARGQHAHKSLDLTIIATIANMAHKNGADPEWLRPFILT